MSGMILTIDDALKTAKDFYGDCFDIKLGENMDVVFRHKLSEKCFLNPDGGNGEDPYQRLMNLILDVNPAEISAQIQADGLQTWCRTVRTEAQKIIFSLIEKDRRLDGGDGGG